MHLVFMVALAVRLSRKGELLRFEFAFKKYISMIDSVFLLFIFAHLSVPILSCRPYSFFSPPSSSPKRTGCST